MKIATSASFFTCPAVDVILHSCDIVYTSNSYAIANFKHPSVQHISKYVAGENEGCEIITFSDLFEAFNEWCAHTATDSELTYWYDYWKLPPTKIRERAVEWCKARNVSKSDVPTS